MRFTSRPLSVEGPAIPLFLGQPALEPVRLSGHEGMNSLFAYELLLKTPDALNLGASEAADFDLNAFVGREISCTIELDGAGTFVAGAVGRSVDAIGAGTRQINAIVTHATFLGEEGRHLQYRLTLAPWLYAAVDTSDCRPFQNKTVVEILDEVLGSYAFPVDKRLLERYPPRAFQLQYNESDFAFFSRLCQEWGISYHFEHSDGKHRLVLTDSMGAYRENPSEAYRAIDYHPPGWKTDAEYLHAFTPTSALTAGAYATRDYDHTRPKADLSVSRSDPRPTGLADAEVYVWHADVGGAHYAEPKAGRAGLGGPAGANDSAAEGRFIATLRMQALRTAANRSTARGNLRGMVPGCTFRLQAHPRQRANTEYLILDTRFLIENVAPDSQIKDAAPGRRQQWRIDVDLTAHPMTEVLRPALTQPKPSIKGPQYALVVGPDGSSSPDGKTKNHWIDKLGRIKVQFLWDRYGKKDQNSSCWIRVSSGWAGNQLGMIHPPRVGQEVLIDFIDGDPDLPICMGRAHNGMNEPPWELPGQAALSGIRSRELTPEGGNSAAGRSNHLLMDDTPGELGAQMKSDHQSSSLSLGYITRVAGHAGRQAQAGEGAELRTDGYAAIRSAKSMLLSTDGRPQGEGSTLARDELVVQLERALALAKELARAAHSGEAGTRETSAQQALQEAVDALGHGMAGERAASDPASPTVTPGGQPVLAMSGAAGIASATPRNHTQYAGGHIDSVAGHNQQQYAGESILQTAGKDIEQFAVAGDIRTIANQGDLIQQAQHGHVEVTAAKRLTLTSTEEDVVVRAGKSITLVLEDGTYLRLADGKVVLGMRGQFQVKSGGRVFQGPSTLPVDMPQFYRADLAQQLKLHRDVGKEYALPGRNYRILKAGGGIQGATSDAQAISPLPKKNSFDIGH